MHNKGDYNDPIKHYALFKVILIFSFIIWSVNPLMAHEPEPEKEKAKSPDEAFSSKEIYFSHIHGIGCNNNGSSILVASLVGIILYTNGHQTIEVHWLSGRKTGSIPYPEISKEDFVSFLAINPKRTNKVVVVTKKRSIHLSKNWRKTWLQIALEGRGFSNEHTYFIHYTY